MSRKFVTYPKTDKLNVEKFIKSYDTRRIAYLNSNDDRKRSFIAIHAIDEIIVENGDVALDKFREFQQQKDDWIFGYFSYDIKNEIETLESDNFDGIQFPTLHFFQPEFVIIIDEDSVQIGYLEYVLSDESVELIYQLLNQEPSLNGKYYGQSSLEVLPRETKESYTNKVNKLKDHIYRGDIYEVNFCQEFHIDNCEIDARKVYFRLNEHMQSPFSCFYQFDEQYLLCGSPERYMRREGKKLISQPIKGTIRRGGSEIEDTELKKKLLEDPKERSENVMIVDLVRNDMSKTAVAGTVKVEELFGIYTFNTVHQMISTISAEVNGTTDVYDVVKSTFPMGSMTGAPKIKAMQLIEEYEETRRGVYSGAVGYIAPSGDFDFNVVIRSILYNAKSKYASVMVGSAITAGSDAGSEYEECLLKAKAMLDVLKSN